MTGSFTCHCGNTGVERTPNKSQHTKLTLKTKILRRSCWESNSQPFDHESGALTNELSRFGIIMMIIMIIIIMIMVIFKRLSLKALSALQKHEGGRATGLQK